MRVSLTPIGGRLPFPPQIRIGDTLRVPAPDDASTFFIGRAVNAGLTGGVGAPSGRRLTAVLESP
jgi:hypothetical protein